MQDYKITVNKDLQCERHNCTFQPIELTHFFDGSPENTEQRHELELRDIVPTEYKSHKEVYEDAVQRACKVFRKIKELQESGKASVYVLRHIFGARLGSGLFRDGNPFVLHYAMFIPSILGQGNTQQQGYWVSRSWSGDIVGTYAQTELGHGTFIRGLETTATYDACTKEFVLNSPTLTSYKWWPGGLGHTANYAIVLAQLYVQNECRGIHPFIVQLRDADTHEPMPGIKIGEIGRKLGMNGVNNGFLGFNNVRIPRMNMLMKNSKVLEDGTYVKASNDKLTYGTMVFVRVVLVHDVVSYLSKAATIAVRYSAVRRQGQINSEKPEVQILDYVTQQYKIFPHVAACFAFKISANWIWDMYNNVTGNQEGLNQLPELHALACCLKAVTTADAAGGIEQLRLSCGGHGYMDSSNLPTTYGLVTAMCTYEGENTVLLLQTARYLVKEWKQAVAGQPLSTTIQYFMDAIKEIKRPWANSLECIIEAHYAVAAGNIGLAVEHMDHRIQNGISPEDAWNQTSIELAYCAEAHCRAFVVKRFVEAVKQVSVSQQLRQVLFQLCEFYALYWTLQKRGDFLQFSSMKKADVLVLQSRLEDLLAIIRPNIVGIVDGFDIHDEILNSTLGSYDGNVYERLFAEAMKSPLNQNSVNESFKKYLKPFLKSNL
ncbi:putative peroxisomal acyl-coenzyme A oxidase 1 [Eufriesea mexicana]|nr:putative peroxisomal acyl-coenzyme A oxidase 1 [Eufriesea mexicana]